MFPSKDHTPILLLILSSALIGVFSYFFPTQKIRGRVASNPTQTRIPASTPRMQNSPFLHAKARFNQNEIEKKFPRIRGRSNIVQGVRQSSSPLPQGLPLVVVTDTECLEKNSTNTPLLPRLRPQYDLKVEAIALSLPQDTDPIHLEDELSREPCIIGVSEDGEVRKGFDFYTDPQISSQNQLSAVRAFTSERFFYFSSLTPPSPTIVAIVDTGIDYNHSDLAANMWRNANGHFGYDFINGDTNPIDDDNHGTHVAGIAGAVGNNGIGGSGILGKNIQLMAVKVLDQDGVGTYSAIANGIRFATDNGAKVINMSLSGPGQNATLEDAMVYALNAGVTIVVAAGNSNIAINGTSSFYSPASYGATYSGIITVGSIDAITLKRSSFSNYSTTHVEIGAPGSNGIFSTIPNNSYAIFQGTSMASPVVAGAAAAAIGALRSKGISYTAADIEHIITDGSISNSNLTAFFKNGKQLDLPSVMELLKNEYLLSIDGGIHGDFPP